ncbi:MAG: hypothetical protein JJ939_12145 [Alphaproteobacteria bacterium]|nr:hypothetical protein [Alphaproteobacteria bacterium]MBO6629164.1 hypothetical protein [Alphaproteobacteria bacterium]
MTFFKHVLSRLGLSQAEAVAFLNQFPGPDGKEVNLGKLKKWCAGKTTQAPGWVWPYLFDLAEKQDTAALIFAEEWDKIGQPDVFEFGLASDDFEAQTLGWPCVGAHLAVAARIWEMTGAEMRIAPRATTPASAASADLREGHVEIKRTRGN